MLWLFNIKGNIIWKRTLCDGIHHLSATVSAFLYNKTRQTLAMIVIKIHLDQVGTMEVILQKKRQKLNIFSAACKVLFSPFLIPRSAAAPTSLQNTFLTRNFKPQPCLIVAIELGKTKGNPSTRKKLGFCWPDLPPPRRGGDIQNWKKNISLLWILGSF